MRKYSLRSFRIVNFVGNNRPKRCLIPPASRHYHFSTLINIMTNVEIVIVLIDKNKIVHTQSVFDFQTLTSRCSFLFDNPGLSAQYYIFTIYCFTNLFSHSYDKYLLGTYFLSCFIIIICRSETLRNAKNVALKSVRSLLAEIENGRVDCRRITATKLRVSDREREIELQTECVKTIIILTFF